MIRSSGVRKGRISVVGFCRQSQGKIGESLNPVFPSVRMAQLFYEFLDRYKEWKIAKLKATIGKIILFFLGLLAFLIPWFLPKIGVIVSLGSLIIFYRAVQYYLGVNQRVSHLYINVHILYHHLSGKLEVGFCDHAQSCHCVEEFQGFVLKNYSITFDKAYLQ